MSAFHLEILTPDHSFFSGDAEALTITCADGEKTVLRGHAPMITPLSAGILMIKLSGEWRSAFQSEGFLETDGEGTRVFLQSCEWAEDIDSARAERAAAIAREQIRQRQSIAEYHNAQMTLARAMARLKIKKNSRGY
jgi:F-type H+-transporting ATPase subunit epsilon